MERGDRLRAAARRDPRVSWAIAEELNRRLYDTLEQTAVSAFGSVRQRVAAHLLDLAAFGGEAGEAPERTFRASPTAWSAVSADARLRQDGVHG